MPSDRDLCLLIAKELFKGCEYATIIPMKYRVKVIVDGTKLYIPHVSDYVSFAAGDDLIRTSYRGQYHHSDIADPNCINDIREFLAENRLLKR